MSHSAAPESGACCYWTDSPTVAVKLTLLISRCVVAMSLSGWLKKEAGGTLGSAQRRWFEFNPATMILAYFVAEGGEKKGELALQKDVTVSDDRLGPRF